jgi:hypothetical protein
VHVDEDQQQAELRSALSQYWELRHEFEKATGKEPRLTATPKARAENEAVQA